MPPANQAPVPARRGRAGGLAGGLAARRAAALRRGPAGARTGAVSRLVPGAAPRRQGRRPAARNAGQPVQADHRAQPGRAQRLRAPRLHAAQPDDARAMRRTAPGRAGLPGRGLRPHHLRHRQPDARRLPELGRGIRAGHHRALLAEGAQGRLAGGSGLRRVLPRRGVDGPAAPPEGGRHLRAADAARRQAQVPGRHAALHRLHPRHRRALPRTGAAAAPARRGRRHARPSPATRSAGSERRRRACPAFYCPAPLAAGQSLALPAGRRAPCAGAAAAARRRASRCSTASGGEFEAVVEHMGRSEVRVQVGAHHAARARSAARKCTWPWACRPTSAWTGWSRRPPSWARPASSR